MARLLMLLLVAAACAATSLLDVPSILGGGYSAIWLTSGVGVAAAMTLGVAALPAVAVGGFVGFAVVSAPQWGDPGAAALLLRAAGFGLAQAAEVALCAALLKRWVGRFGEPNRALDGLRWLFAVAFSAWLGALLVAVGLLGVAELGQAPLAIWTVARVAGVLLLAPLVLAWTDTDRRSPARRRPIERLALHTLAVGVLLTTFDFLDYGPDSPLLAALVLMFPLLAAWRLGERDAVLIAAYTVAFAVWATHEGLGPLFGHGTVPGISILVLFLVVPTLTAVGMLAPAKSDAPRKGTNSLDRSVEPRLEPTTDHSAAAPARAFYETYEDQPTMMFTLDENGRILHANRFAAEQLGYQQSEIQGRRVSDLHLEGQRDLETGKIEECLAHSKQVYHWQGCMLRKDGSPLWVRQSARSVTGPEAGHVVLLACDDVSEARELSMQLAHEARHDTLTGLANRSEIDGVLGGLLGEDSDASSDHALLYLDLDQYQAVVEAGGHAAGDALLRSVARLLRGTVRRGDTLARLSEGEFAILLEGCGLEHAMRVARTARTGIGDFRFLWENQAFMIGVSIGVVPLNGQKGTGADVMRTAEVACHAAKDEGRNRIHVYRHDDARQGRRQWETRWVASITEALDEGRFHLCYQPIVPLHDNVSGERRFELLLRMRDNNGRVVPPSAFLPAAERYGLASRLDRWVLRNALSWLQSGARAGTSLDRFAINLSGQSVADPDFLRFAESHLRSSGIAGERICFEITESAAIGDTGAAMAFMRALKALGCRFALDNFGRGLSSLGYLRTLPVDVVKIDGRFVTGMFGDPVDSTMLESISRVGNVMGRETVAERVEDPRMLDRLREAGLAFAQGYCFSRPQPLDQFHRAPADSGLVAG